MLGRVRSKTCSVDVGLAEIVDVSETVASVSTLTVDMLLDVRDIAGVRLRSWWRKEDLDDKAGEAERKCPTSAAGLKGSRSLSSGSESIDHREESSTLPRPEISITRPLHVSSATKGTFSSTIGGAYETVDRLED